MKHYFILLLISGYGLVSAAQSNSEKEPYITRSLSNESIKKVLMETTGGNISVFSAGSSDPRLEVYVQGNNGKNSSLSKDEIKKRLEEFYDLNISVNDNKLTAKAEPKHKNMDWKRSVSISFKAYVPANVSTDLSTSGGNINLKGISGTQNFTTSGGNLNIEDVAGKIKGRTSGGNLNLRNLKDEIDLSTSGGNVDAENCIGNIKLTTSGGSVN
jgi:hypothetical protein